MGITHEWNGTVLTITSDSGTSSADLRGEKGDTGVRGPQGVAGNDGNVVFEDLTEEQKQSLINVDGTFNPESINAQSGKAVEQALVSYAEPKTHWEYYGTYEVTEENVATFDSKTLGKAAGITGIYVKTYSPIVTTGNAPVVNLRVFNSGLNTEIRVGTDGYCSTSKEAYGQMMIYLDRGLWDGWWLSAANTQGNVWRGKYGLRQDYAGKTVEDVPYIHRFYVGSTSSGYYLPIGFRMEMWVLKNG